MNEDEFTRLMKRKYEKRIGAAISKDSKIPQNNENIPITSKDYNDFLNQFAPSKMNFYEKMCRFSESLFKVAPPKNMIKSLKEDIETAHLNITPEGAMSFAMVFPIFFILFGLLLMAVLSFLTGQFELIVMLFILGFGVLMIQPFQKIPALIATRWRMRASNQMILCIFYVVTYLRHTSNLEAAIRFAANHLTPPLSIDLKKILWDVESGRYSTITEALNAYLERWRGHNDEFIETFRIIESTLSESSNERRMATLDRALNSILEATYEKMLTFAQNLKSPIDSLNMMGIVLPILSLIILPLVAGMMEGVKWYHISMMYNVLIPFLVFYMALEILSTRPTGYGGSGVEDEFVDLSKKQKVDVNISGIKFKITPMAAGAFIFVVFLAIGFSPLIIRAFNPNFELPIIEGIINFMGYITPPDGGKPIGPFGLGAVVLSFFIPLGLGLGLGVYKKLRYKNLNEMRKDAETLEKEFESSLYMLGNRLADGTSPEMAISHVAETTTGSIVARFFSIIADNIRRLGMGVDEAIFDKQRGALSYYPSNIIESAMKILTESIRRGYQVASRAMMNFAEYLKQIHRVNERLKDILTDVLSSIKSQMSFLTPLIGGIVVGITGLLSNIINLVNEKAGSITSQNAVQGAPTTGVPMDAMSFFGVGIPTYYFQLVVGFYVVEVIIIMSYLHSTIEKGEDNVHRGFSMGNDVIRGTMLYFLVGVVTSIMFSLITIGIRQFMGT